MPQPPGRLQRSTEKILKVSRDGPCSCDAEMTNKLGASAADPGDPAVATLAGSLI